MLLPRISPTITPPASSTDNAVIRWDGTTGRVAQDSAFVVDDSGYVTSQGVFISAPTGTGVSQGSIYINPASANADETLFGVALNGASRFLVDEDGDVTIPDGAAINFRSDVSLYSDYTNRLRTDDNFSAKAFFLQGDQVWAKGSLFGSTASIFKPPSNWGLVFQPQGTADIVFHQTVAGQTMFAGLGVKVQVSLAANLDQDDVIIKRDVDGDSSYSEAGSVLTLKRRVMNVTSEDGNFLEMQTVGGTIVAQVYKDGSIEVSAGFGLDITPQAQQAHIVDADGQLADVTTKFNTLLADLEGYGLLASS